MQLLLAVSVLLGLVTTTLASETDNGHEGVALPQEPIVGWQDVSARYADLDTIEANMALLKKKFTTKQQQKIELACDTCGVVAAAMNDIAQNTKDRAEAEKLIKKTCAALLPNKTVDDIFCNVVPDLLLTLMPIVDRFRFNIPNILCADFFHLCVEPCCDTHHQPEQVHLSFATSETIAKPGAPISMRAAWTTLRSTSSSSVWWRKKGASTWNTNARGEWRTYDIGGWVGILHSAVMTGLVSNTTYQYKVGSAQGSSSTFEFTTLPVNAGSKERPLNILGVADMGWANFSQASINAMKKMVQAHEIDYIVHPGDIGYADGDQTWWDVFFREMEPIMSAVPYMTGPGNHECVFYNCTAYKKRFWMPSAGHGAPSDAMYYRLNTGPVKFYMLDSETWFDTPNIGEVQQTWLKKVFAKDAVSKEGPTLKFVTHHRPMYCSSEDSLNCKTYSDILRSQVEDLYHQNRVAMVMVGHIHNYQRSYPVYKNTTMQTSYDNTTAPMYLVNGGAGNREGQSNWGPEPQNPWSAFRTRDRTIMTYKIYSDDISATTASTTTTITVEAKTWRSSTLEVIDAFNLTQIF